MFEAICMVVYFYSVLAMLIITFIVSLVGIYYSKKNGKHFNLTGEAIQHYLKVCASEIFIPVYNTYNVIEFLVILFFNPSYFKYSFID